MSKSIYVKAAVQAVVLGVVAAAVIPVLVLRDFLESRSH